jgi:AraC-like DNA-binding protein
MLAFDQIANLAILKQFYYLVWRLFGVNIALVSPDRKRALSLGATSWSPFCIQLRQMGGEAPCLKCDQQYLAAAQEQRRSMRYQCWAGLREFIVPIILDGEILAFIQCGQVLDSPPSEENWSASCQAILAQGLPTIPPKEVFFSQRVIQPQTQEDLITLLELFGNYIAYAQYQILMAEATQQSRVEERALSFIRNHFTEPISLDDVAEAACTSKRNLTRIFQAKTGMTVLDSIQEMRIAKACGQLQAGEMTCMQIAYDCGFGSVQQFNRVFQKLHHCTPQTWQRGNRDQKRALTSPLSHGRLPPTAAAADGTSESSAAQDHPDSG